MTGPRRDLEATWRFLEHEGHEMPRDSEGRPVAPTHLTGSEPGDVWGVSFDREAWEDTDFSNLTLPRTRFIHAVFDRVSFANSDLSESLLRLCDFRECDFSEADLSNCDLRLSEFKACRFVGAKLRAADLRSAAFESCDFTGASLLEAVSNEMFTGFRGLMDSLSPEQLRMIAWRQLENDPSAME